MTIETVAALEQNMPYQNGAHVRALKKLQGTEDITVNATTQAISVLVYETRMTSAAASSVATLPAGDYIGQRKLIVFEALGTAGDAVAITPGGGVTWKQADGSTACASVTFSAADKFLLVEWQGDRWLNIRTDATVA